MRKLFFVMMAIKVVIVVVLLFFGGTVKAAPPTEEQIDACRDVLEANFNAFNYEDAGKLMDTIAVSASDSAMRARFREEAEKLFAEEDVYITLGFFDPFWAENGKLRAMVVQTTTKVGDENGVSAYNGIGAAHFRERSGLLPPWRHAYYLQEFEYDKKSKRWLVGAIVGRPKTTWDPAKSPPPRKTVTAAKESAARAGCKDGTCSSPMIRVKMR